LHLPDSNSRADYPASACRTRLTGVRKSGRQKLNCRGDQASAETRFGRIGPREWGGASCRCLSGVLPEQCNLLYGNDLADSFFAPRVPGRTAQGRASNASAALGCNSPISGHAESVRQIGVIARCRSLWPKALGTSLFFSTKHGKLILPPDA
jgi:hypothetical protein